MARKNSKKKRFAAESEISNWIVQLIKNNALRDSISNVDEIEQYKNTFDQPNFIPSFSIDYLSKLASVNAANYVLSNLGLLEVIAVDKSISIEKGQVLRTDVIAFNPEQNTLIVFELKRDTATERQTVTELMGYEQELKNMFLFLGNFDICFVVIAKDWSTLLDHAVGSMIAWSGKQTLALKIEENSDGARLLTCHIPEAWSLRGSFGTPVDVFQTLDIVLYQSDQYDGTVEQKILSTTLDLIARNGDRSNSHGFAILSKLVQPLANAKWIITICAIDPLEMFNWCLVNGLPIRDSEVVKFFKKNTHIIPQPPAGISEVYSQALKLLEDIYEPAFESYFTLEQKLKMLKLQSSPVQFEFWGKLGEYSRDFVCNESVRHNLAAYIGRMALDWRYPEVAVPLLGYLTNQWPFSEGRIHCKDLFNVGVAIGTSYITMSVYESSKTKLPVDEVEFLMWTDLEVLKNVIELNQFYRGTTINNPPPHLARVDLKSRKSSLESLVSWVNENVIRGSEIHSRCFELGIQGASFFSDWISFSLRDAKDTPMQRSILNIGQAILRILVVALRNSRDVDSQKFLKILKNTLSPKSTDLDNNSINHDNFIDSLDVDLFILHFEKIILSIIDQTIPVVPHQSLSRPKIKIDVDWARKGIDTLYAAGHSHPAIFVKADGTVTTGHLTGKMLILPPVVDRTTEVFFQDETASTSIALKRRWDELQQDGV